MNRRTLIASLGSLTASSMFAVGSGAFTSVSAERTVTVETASDYEALLGLTERGSGLRSKTDGGRLIFELPGGSEDEYPTGNPTNPSGLGSDSVYRFGQDAGSGPTGLFGVENLGTQPVEVYSTQTETSGVPEVTMYDVESGNLLTKASPSTLLSSGNQLLCGLEVNTHGVPVQETEYDVTLTINAVAADE
jgi:hypothetical protein